jgi:hypothetical protein
MEASEIPCSGSCTDGRHPGLRPCGAAQIRRQCRAKARHCLSQRTASHNVATTVQLFPDAGLDLEIDTEHCGCIQYQSRNNATTAGQSGATPCWARIRADAPAEIPYCPEADGITVFVCSLLDPHPNPWSFRSKMPLIYCAEAHEVMSTGLAPPIHRVDMI